MNNEREHVEASKKKVLAVYPGAFAHQVLDGDCPWAIFFSGNQKFGTIYKWSETEGEAWIEFASRLPTPVEPKAQVESGEGLPPLDIQRGEWELTCRERQLQASLLREKGLVEGVERLKGLLRRAISVCGSSDEESKLLDEIEALDLWPAHREVSK